MKHKTLISAAFILVGFTLIQFSAQASFQFNRAQVIKCSVFLSNLPEEKDEPLDSCDVGYHVSTGLENNCSFTVANADGKMVEVNLEKGQSPRPSSILQIKSLLVANSNTNGIGEDANSSRDSSTVLVQPGENGLFVSEKTQLTHGLSFGCQTLAWRE